jgi:hypothetical protein
VCVCVCGSAYYHCPVFRHLSSFLSLVARCAHLPVRVRHRVSSVLLHLFTTHSFHLASTLIRTRMRGGPQTDLTTTASPILSPSPSAATATHLTAITTANPNHSTCSERFVNIPLQVAPLMFNALLEDVASDAGAAAGLPCDSYVYVVKSVEFTPTQKSPRSRKGKSGRGKAKQRRGNGGDPVVQYSNPEDELLLKRAKMQHTFYADDGKEASMNNIRSASRLPHSYAHSRAVNLLAHQLYQAKLPVFFT